MSDPWADSLSEDWVSQPRDSPPPPQPSPRILHESSTTNRRPSSASLSSSTGTENIRGGGKGKKGTPEWKRMVMGDFTAPGGKDLFSPMQLECMFRPPTIGPSSAPTELMEDPLKKDSPKRTPAKWKSNIPIPTSSPLPLLENKNALFSPSHARTKSATSITTSSPATTTSTASKNISKLRQSPDHRESSSASSIPPSLTPDGKRSPERHAETETSGMSDLRMNENWSSIRVPDGTGPVYSRTTSSDVRQDEDISSIMVDRLRLLKEPGGSFDMSPPGTIGSTLAAHDSQYLPTNGDSDGGSEAADIVPELLSAPPTGPRRRKSLLSIDGESSIYPSSPPVLGYNYPDSDPEDDYDASYLEKSISSDEDPYLYASPSKQPAAEDLAQKLLASPFLPAGQEPRNLSSPTKRPAPVLPPQGELPGAAGNSILDNIRRHKDAPKSPVKPPPTPPPRNESMSPDEREDPFFTPHAFRHQLLSEDSDGGRDKTRFSGSPLKLFASFYDTYTNERLTRRLGELETSVEDEGNLKVPGGEEYDSQLEETDISFSGGSIIVNRLEKMARKQEKAKSPSRRVKPASTHRHASAPEASPKRTLADGYRKHRRWKSDESGGAADGVEAPKSPLKERTPKRVRRNKNGVYNQRGPSSGVPPVPGLLRAKSEEPPRTPVGKMGRVTDGVTPTSAAKRKERKVPVLKKNYEYGDPTLSPGVNVSPRKDGGAMVFSGSHGDGVEGEGFEMPSPMQPETVRKGSVTTQDFLDQADAVMNRIRDRGLRSVALDFHSPGSQYSVRDDGSYYDEQSLRTSPRRDSDTAPLIPDSPLQNEALDIHVTKNSSSREGSFDGKSSTVKTAVSSSSRKSAVEVISPGDAVMSHHLARKNNGMTFDEEKMTWVKRGSSPQQEAEEEQAIKVEDSDPFIGISDLSVDSQEEARALELARRNWEGMASDGEKSGLWRSSRMMGIDEEDEEDGIGDETWDRQQWFGDEEEEVAVVGGGEQSTVGSGSSERSSRSTRPGSGAETRTTSYGSDENKEKVEKVEEDETEEITRGDIKSSEPLRRARNSYAEEYDSPNAQSLVQDSSSPGEHRLLWTDEGDSATDGGTDGYLEHGGLRQQRRNTSRTFSSAGTYRGAARRRSSGAKNFIGRPISRITEEEEDDHHGPTAATPAMRELSRISMSSALTPLPSPFMSKVNSLSLSATRKINDMSFQMTPLADLSYQFETTDALINLELSFFATRKGVVNAKAIEASFTIARDNLLKNLTDVEPYEPYWDHMKELDLVGRNVETLFTLNDWCPRLEALDVSDNELGQLSGVSDTMRDLKVAGNCLSGITHFGHLVNLQYLDLCRNGLENLDGLRGLKHLRELRADDNIIENIDGVLGMDGLGVLRARRNRLLSVDFEKATMPRLTELDLRGNDIECVSGLQNLPALINLNLDQNNLDSLNVPLGIKLDTIRCIKLTQNYFETFDVSQYPNLRILYMDNNRLRSVEGLTRAKHLDAISTREQENDGRECTLKFERMYEARKIYMSGNPLRDLTLKMDFLNLQYLELASAQLTTLPKDFGYLICNTRVLNLNNNAISDLRPLLGIVRLKKLLLVGNRVKSVKKIAAVLGYFPSLSYLDMRMNPLTIGFYPPPSSVRKAILPVEDPDEYLKDPFTMMPADESIDHTFQAQLDIDSAVVRRTYEITIGRRCPRMKELDGLQYGKDESMREDEVFEELKNRGLIKAPDSSAASRITAPSAKS